jgi:glycosyltransferase involved in cell wall biosynthesis
MRIAYLHYLVPDDTGRHHVRQFAAGARALGHEVEVVAMNLAAEGGGVPGAGGVRRSRLRDWAVRRAGRYLHEPKELLWNALYVRRELGILRRLRPDVLLVRDHALTASCVTVARKLRLPLVLELNAPAEETRLYLDEYLHLPGIARTLEAYKVRRAGAVTVVSSTLKSMLVEAHGIPPERIVVVPNGADLARFHPGVVPDPAIVWPPGSGPVIGFVGSFRRWHGTDLLRRMIVEVAAARPRTAFLLVGDGPERTAVRDAIAALGSRVTMTGRVPHDRVPALTASFDIGVLPETLFYGSPLKVVEWMAAGRSVVAPGYPAMADLYEDGVHGLCFTPKDGGAFAAAVLRLVDDPALRARLGGAAAQRARSALSWVDNARRVVAACEIARAAGAPAAPPVSRAASR